MECIICGGSMSYFFTKTFDRFELTEVHYHKCVSCGFCSSQTHFEMSNERWARLNESFHDESHRRDDNPFNRNQRYLNQAQMLHVMRRHGLIEDGHCLDWGCGIGSVAILLDKYFDFELSTYDKYYTPHINEIRPDQLQPRAFDLVLNTAVFEHVRSRATLDEIESYVSETGAFAVHTLVPENVPKDPDWMYLLPVHCAFHTNKSMQRLMDDWGYTCSVYNEFAKLWVMFKADPDVVAPLAAEANAALGWQYLRYKRGFMDYWK